MPDKPSIEEIALEAIRLAEEETAEQLLEETGPDAAERHIASFDLSEAERSQLAEIFLGHCQSMAANLDERRTAAGIPHPLTSRSP